jgi:hypothetical protein
MAKPDDFAKLYENLKSKTLEITRILDSIKIPDEHKTELNLQMREIEKIFSREPNKTEPDSVEIKPIRSPKQPSPARKKRIKIEVRNLDGKMQSAFYIDDDLKPDKISIQSWDSCNKVKLKVSGGNFKKYKTVHVPGDCSKDALKFVNIVKKKELDKE